jgi:hypothetical protein
MRSESKRAPKARMCQTGQLTFGLKENRKEPFVITLSGKKGFLGFCSQ